MIFTLEAYFLTYTVIVIGYLWYQFFFVLVPNEKKYPYYPTTFSVIVPSYNEPIEAVERGLRSIIAADGEKEIILVDDGSEQKYREGLSLMCTYLGVKFIQMPQNVGKRHAQAEGFKIARNEIIITIDSDTIINKDSLLEVARPFNDREIGAVSGVIELYNKDENLFTRMLNGRYLNSFHFERKAQASYGGVNCCSGGFSAYRANIIKPNIYRYLNQKFMGRECTFGDDRHLTNIVLETHKVTYSKYAIAKTVSPSSLKKFIKQQIRWKQSFIRENFITIKTAFNQKKELLLLDTIIAGGMPIFSLLVRVLMIVNIIIYPMSIFYYITLLSVIALIRNSLIIKDNKKEAWYAILYGFFHVGIVYWVYYISFYKLFFRPDGKWITRGDGV